jgi:primosomal protein N' (replication factor Y) (superfamily II helicase)
LYYRVAVPSPLRRCFDYLPPVSPVVETLPRGSRVVVPFGARKVVGMVVAIVSKSDQPEGKLRPIEEVLDPEPLLSEMLLDLFLWSADYYLHPVGDALLSTLPALLRKGRELPTNLTECWQLSPMGHGLDENSLARAPKQQRLLNHLRQYGPLETAEITAQNFSKATLKALLSKALVERIQRAPLPSKAGLREPPLALRKDQKRAMAALALKGYQPYLLFGDTGTGKTEIYLQAIEKIITAGKQALVLVPEINLTPQTLSRFRNRFDANIVSLHSGLTDRERLENWASARRGDADIVIGTRSAIFTPLARPGILILDEEHDTSFKQQDGFRYSARDVAVLRASKEQIPILLGSATPSLESLHNCERGRYHKLELTQRDAPNLQWQLVDLKQARLQSGLSAQLLDTIRVEVNRGNQVLLLLNRRGYAPLLMCHDCGWRGECRHCSATLTAHLNQKRLICHHCESQQPIPRRCDACRSPNLTFVGQGTERCEETLREMFPATKVLRIDRDTTQAKHAMASAIDEIQRNEPCILVGTQMLSKGHHFPAVTLAALVEVDSGLFSTDIRALERTSQLVTQVAGRAGRGTVKGRVLIQSHHVDHPLLSALTQSDYRSLAAMLLDQRRQHHLPPFSHLAMIRAESIQQTLAYQFLMKAKQFLERISPATPEQRYLGPLPAVLERRKGFHRFVLSIYSNNRNQRGADLQALCRELESDPAGRKIRWSIDVDPQDSP